MHEARVEDIKVADLREAFLKAPPLQISDIVHSPQEEVEFKTYLIHCMARIIVQFGGHGFEKFKDDLDKTQPASKKKIEVHKTELFPLPAMHIDESTIIGNADVDAAIANELQIRDSKFLDLLARFFGGDQLSLARRRALELLRAGHESDYHGWFWGVDLIGLFHGKIADAHGTLLTHFGKPNAGTRNPCCLAFHNTRLDRLPITTTSLPPFRTCRDLIFVSLYARVLHCLLLVSGYTSLDEYLSNVNSWLEVYSHAEKIYETYLTPGIVDDLRFERDIEVMEQANQERTNTDPPIPTEGDMVFENAILFLRDALISREFTDAVKAGDSGRILLVLKTWALSFRGNGRTKYAYEMLHVVHNLTSVWPEPIRYAL